MVFYHILEYRVYAQNFSGQEVLIKNKSTLTMYSIIINIHIHFIDCMIMILVHICTSLKKISILKKGDNYDYNILTGCTKHK